MQSLMLHKHFKRARRTWEVVEESGEIQAAAEWAWLNAEPLIKEVQRLRTELKSRNKKKRHVHAKLAAERDDHDDLLVDIEKFQEWVSSFDILSKDVLNKRLDEILEPYREDDCD